MIHAFSLDFVRATLEQTLLKEHIKNNYYFGGDNLIKITSFYEQLKQQDEVDRFVEVWRDIVDQQNRANLIGNGVIVTSENPTLTNLFSAMIIPFTWTTSIRIRLDNRDQMVDTLCHLIEELKGSKVDIAELKCLNELGTYSYVPFVVGTIGHDEQAPYVHDGDFIGTLPSGATANTYIKSRLSALSSLDIATSFNANGGWLYLQRNTLTGHKLCVAKELLYHEFEIEDFVIESYEIESGPTGYKNVNGQVSFASQEWFDEAVSVEDFLGRFTLVDTDNPKYYEAEITEIEVSIDSDGYLYCVGSFSFNVPTSDFNDWNDVELAEWEPAVDYVRTPNIHDWTEITSDTRDDIIFPPEHVDFEKYKLSLSFDSLRIDTPKTLNAEEYCEISFSGSATLVNEKVKLGNDLVKVYFQKNKIVASEDISLDSTKYYLEPLEMPSGNGASTIPNLLKSNSFKTNTHTDGITLRLQYSFVLDESIALLKDWFDYGRYGTQTNISPNIIYNVGEYWSAWGDVELKAVLAKLVESVEIENTESDTLTLGITMQIQGENN